MFIYLASPFASAKFERNSFARTVKYKLKIIRKYPLQSARERERERESRGLVTFVCLEIEVLRVHGLA